jgi:hypothetical protein
MQGNYKIIKEFISNQLRNRNNVLESDEIYKHLIQTKLLLSSDIGIQLVKLSHTLFNENQGIEGINWEKLKKELEMNFNVKMEKGITLTGNNSTRDKTWWTGKGKQESERFYWERYRNYINQQLPGNIVNTIDDDTDIVMNNTENPKLDYFQRLGMVVGNVQSGKTSNYAGLVCKAADAGYKFIVVIAGGMNNLRDQTQKRLLEAFVGHDMGKAVGVGIGNFSLEKQPISLTTVHKDFNKRDADQNSQGNNFDNTSVPILIVIKKNTSMLKNVTKWLQNHYKNKINHPMLVIDDESDYASINTKEENDPTAINKAIRKMLGLFHKSSYVAYTATPYANIFIDHSIETEEYGKDLFPKDFIHCLEAPSNYFGSEKIFKIAEDEKRKHVVEIEDNEMYIPLTHKKDTKIKNLPPSLKEAIRVFLLNIAIRNLRGDGNKHNSMLIHVSRFTAIHQNMRLLTDNYLIKLKKSIISYCKLTNAHEYDKNIEELMQTYGKYYGKSIDEQWHDVRESLHDTVEKVVIREVHQNKDIPLEYRDDVSTNAIVIGGASLSRGVTLEGLSVSYFLRNTLFYDTLMQMGRWFGYRPKYEDLCKIYMTETMADNFEHITEATNELIYELKKMSRENCTPEEFGLAIRQHPESALQITARNKQKNAKNYIVEMNLSGTLKQTTWLTNKDEEISKNFTITKELINRVKPKKINIEGSHCLFENVEKSEILNFIENFKVHKNDHYGFTSHLPLEFIKGYIKENDINWDIGLYSGSGDTVTSEHLNLDNERVSYVKRQISKNEGKCYKLKMLSGPADEGLTLSEKEKRYAYDGKNWDRKKIREKLNKPLLMLYLLEGNGEVNKKMPAYGISFPNIEGIQRQVVTVTINSVFCENLLENIEDNEEE